jgi:hypothetical protein
MLPAYADIVLPRISPKASVMQTIGTTDLTVTYSRPGVKGREIWGKLVPYDAPWRTGANEATTFTTTTDVTVGGQTLPAGTYSFFTLPKAGDWSVVFSRQKDLWGAYEYDPKQDALRVTIKPTPAEPVEWMRFTFDNLTPNSSDLVLRWEKVELKVPITVDVDGIVMKNVRTELAAAKPDDWRTRLRAAQYTFDSGQHMDEGTKWLDESIAIQQGYSNLGLRARWLAKEGKKDEAVATAKKAIELGKAAKEPVNTTQMETLVAEWTGEKK